MKIGNKFEMIILAAARAREISREQNRNYELGKNTGPSACVKALKEIDNGTLTWNKIGKLD